jgi:LmbE family N-acetylglucosaminyl deacetylase
MKILTIGAYPGDIEFGCAGALYKYRLKGHKTDIVLLQEDSDDTDSDIIQKPLNIIGIKNFYNFNIDREEGYNKKTIIEIKKIIEEAMPDLIFTPYFKDTDSLRYHCTKIVLEAGTMTRNILFYETVTSYSFTPTIFIDISALIDKKLDALNTYKSSLQNQYPHELDITEIANAKSKIYGFKINAQNAEGFCSERLIINI